MNTGIIICGIICGTIIILSVIAKLKQKPKEFKYGTMVVTNNAILPALDGLSKNGKKIAGVALDYRSPETIKYLIIYQEDVDE